MAGCILFTDKSTGRPQVVFIGLSPHPMNKYTSHTSLVLMVKSLCLLVQPPCFLYDRSFQHVFFQKRLGAAGRGSRLFCIGSKARRTSGIKQLCCWGYRIPRFLLMIHIPVQRLMGKSSSHVCFEAPFLQHQNDGYPLVNVYSLLWKDPPFSSWVNSTISMAMFNSYFDITRG